MMALTTVMAVSLNAQNPQKGDYGYLYCHMNGNGRAWTAYALSRDGLHYHDLLRGDSVFSDAEHARIEGATRDAYIFRRHDCTGYLMLCTDMNVGAFKRLNKQAEWDNYGITLLRSDDLIHWESTSFDYRKGPSIFCDTKAQGKKAKQRPSAYKDWSTINRVWAPQAVWDPTYRWPDGRQGGYFVYYSMWNRGEEKYDRMYYSYANEDFTELTQPRLLFDWGYATIDADINWLETDRQWHMMIKKEGGQPGLFTSASKKLTGPWPEPVADDYVNFEGKKKCEGVSAFQLAGDEEWTIAYIEYSSRPKNYRFCKADKFMRNFRDPRNIEGVSGPQHGSFLRLTKAEYDRLEEWNASLTSQTSNLKSQITNLTDGWLFSRDKKKWQTVSVPHDWAISGPFDKKWDLQVVAIEQNGEKTPTEKSGRSGSLPWIGEGHYKRNIFIPAGFSGHAELLFDGAMAEPTVYVNRRNSESRQARLDGRVVTDEGEANGRKAGYWAYGYNTFRVDITDFVKPGANLVEVDLQNVEESSRWYPGAGIYRPVNLILKGKDWIDPWQTYIRTTAIEGNRATVEVTVGTGSAAAEDLAFEVELRDQRGRIVDHRHFSMVNGPLDQRSLATSGTQEWSMVNGQCSMVIDNAQLWTPETPYLYKAHIKLMRNGQLLDEIVQNVGLRTVKVSKEGGFQLNGVTRKLKGVCLHHDLGPLGAAVNKAALIRQIKTMKAMGCDAIRTSHNMPSQMQMDLCDSLGMMVMAESFDMWRYPKCKNGYARFFDEWSDRDIEHLVLANRNHPSIVMWSIGNEIPEQGDKSAVAIINRLQGLCHKLDPSRPVTQGLDRVDNALQSGFAQAMDIPGLNYRLPKYEQAYKTLTHGFLLGSETTSTVSSRGVYKFPVEINDYSRFSSWMPSYDPKAVKGADGQCSGYDVEHCAWSNLPDDDWRRQEDYPWVIGEFVWTGYDYLGEPTPFDEYWPSRSSYFGICDLAGLPKDRYYLYRSHWNRQEHTIHLLPHWSWGTTKKDKVNRIGQVTPVYCYTDYPEGELFVNGKSQGRVKKVQETAGQWKPENRLDRYRLRWNNVVYEPGEVRVVVYDEQGRKAGEQTMRTAGQPANLKLDIWTQQSDLTPLTSHLSSLKADGQDLAFVTVSLTDKDGTLIPDAADQLRFEVQGAGTFRAVCNGDATSLEPFTTPTMRLFNGQLVVIVQAGYRPGPLTLKVIDDERQLTQQVTIEVK